MTYHAPWASFYEPPGSWPLPSGHYFGNVAGPANCHGGYWKNPWEHDWIVWIQTGLVWMGQYNYSSGWADGVWGNPTDQPMYAWHNNMANYYGWTNYQNMHQSWTGGNQWNILEKYDFGCFYNVWKYGHWKYAYTGSDYGK